MFPSELIPCLMVALPLVGAVLVLLSAPANREQARWTALTNVLLTFVLSLLLVSRYNVPELLPPNADDIDRRELVKQTLQMGRAFPWLSPRVADEPVAGAARQVDTPVRLAFAVDGISLWLIVLAALLMIPAVLVSWNAIEERPARFYALMLLLEAGMIGVFAAQDIILFYIFFEFTLIPLFFMIGIWGGSDRRWAARKFFIYTLAGSVLTFLGLLFIVLSEQWMTNSPALTFSIPELTASIQQQIATNPQNAEYWGRVSPWIFAALFAGFAIKVPLFPFHTWLPLAHVEAPTAGSVLLAGVLLKIGSYGFLRFALPLVPGASVAHFHLVAILAVIGIIYGALLALAQEDIKKLVAYSSVSHMGFCVLGLFAFNTVGLTGGLLQMINHGLSTGALFALVGMLYERYHTRDIASYGGLARKYPRMAFCLLVVAFSSIGLPGLNGFTGEVTSLMGMFATNRLYGTLSLAGIILGAWYTLSLVRRTFFGRLREPVQSHAHSPVVSHHQAHGQPHAETPLTDLNLRELCALGVLIVPIFWIGLYPQFFTRRMQPSLQPIAALLQEQGAAMLAQQGALPVERPAQAAAPAASSAKSTISR
jgi:NADH-quinone oxidoreductase subunit M